MIGIQEQSITFDKSKLLHAREISMELCYELSSLICPGMSEADAHLLYKELCLKKGILKNWHPTKIRFGSNTLLNFKDPSVDYILKENDVFFIDIGPVIDGYEADYGETFSIGDDYEHRRICVAAKEVFREVANAFKTQRYNGPQLYKLAQDLAETKGYVLNINQDGHRVGEFPHHLIFKGALLECPEIVIPDAWILEIHLWHPNKKFGAFFEDILS